MNNNNYKIEENIVNIAMRAGELLLSGKMERDDISGHQGLTNTIISLAYEFEKQYAGIDFDAAGKDYWEEIDQFAEKQLLERYGIEQERKDLDIKVIIDEGVVHAVLKNDSVPVNVEIVDIDPDYEDYESLDDYRRQLYEDKSYCNCDYTVARFDEEELSGPGQDIPEEEKVLVVPYVGNTEGAPIFSGTWDECNAFCKENAWTYWDENNFRWELTIEDPREELLPEGYYTAVEHYSELAGDDIETGYVRQHADKLICCHQNDVAFEDFLSWTKAESLLEETISFEEYKALDQVCSFDITDICPENKEVIAELRKVLTEYREDMAQWNPHLFTCLADKEFMFLVKAVDLADAEKTGEQWYASTCFEPGHFSCWVTKKDDYPKLSTQDTIVSHAYRKEFEKAKASLTDLILSASKRTAQENPSAESRVIDTDHDR